MDLLTRVEEMILLMVCRLEDRAYGVSIRQEMEGLTGEAFSVGAIYVPLERLTERGFLQSYQGEPTPERGGRRKRYYKITAKGIASLKQTRELYDKMWAGLPDNALLRVQGGVGV